MLAPAKDHRRRCSRIVFNDYVDATLCGLFMAVVVSMVVFGVMAIFKALGNPHATTVEVGHGAAA